MAPTMSQLTAEEPKQDAAFALRILSALESTEMEDDAEEPVQRRKR